MQSTQTINTKKKQKNKKKMNASAAWVAVDEGEGFWWLAAVLRAVPWYYMALGSSAIFFFWESYLDLRQIRHLLSADRRMPPVLREWVVIDQPRMKKRNARVCHLLPMHVGLILQI
jgi:hypothetical protein